MSPRPLSSTVVTVVGVLALSAVLAAQGPAPVKLPAPKTDGGMPLMQALKARHSEREFGRETLSPQVLSNLLWAAWGINRPDGHRTAPSASNKQEIEIYVTLPDGAFAWDAKTNTLNPVAAGDLRGATGTQPFPATAALNLVYVADMTKAGRPATDPQQAMNIGADAGVIVQNVYLFCASDGLVSVVRASVPQRTRWRSNSSCVTRRSSSSRSQSATRRNDKLS